jgi:RNA polymerase sigma-70 factor (ECF subfamily)
MKIPLSSRIPESDMDDRQAIRSCLTGNRDAFQYLVQRYQRRALAHGRALTGNDADAADAAQEAFVDAFTHLARFDARLDFYPWFYVLLRNRCFKQRTRRATRGESAELPDRPVASAAAEDVLDLRAALDRLDAADREVIVLKHVDGWTYDEIAARLSIPRGTVMSRLFTARRRLQLLIRGAGR